MKMIEPPIGSVVVDKSGGAWQRQTVGWVMSGSDGSWNYSWKKLLKSLNETMDCPTPIWAPVLNDPRLPFIVYIPHEELIVEDEE